MHKYILNIGLKLISNTAAPANNTIPSPLSLCSIINQNSAPATPQEQQQLTASLYHILINSCHADIQDCRENTPTATTLQNGNPRNTPPMATILQKLQLDANQKQISLHNQEILLQRLLHSRMATHHTWKLQLNANQRQICQCELYRLGINGSMSCRIKYEEFSFSIL